MLSGILTAAPEQSCNFQIQASYSFSSPKYTHLSLFSTFRSLHILFSWHGMPFMFLSTWPAPTHHSIPSFNVIPSRTSLGSSASPKVPLYLLFSHFFEGGDVSKLSVFPQYLAQDRAHNSCLENEWAKCISLWRLGSKGLSGSRSGGPGR